MTSKGLGLYSVSTEVSNQAQTQVDDDVLSAVKYSHQSTIVVNTLTILYWLTC